MGRQGYGFFVHTTPSHPRSPTHNHTHTHTFPLLSPPPAHLLWRPRSRLPRRRRRRARARAFAKKLSDAPLAIVDKRRSAHNVSEVVNIIGDVKGKVAVLVDDMIDTAGTITNAAVSLHEEGAAEVYACTTHAVLSPPATERLASGVFQEVIVTNTIPIARDAAFPS